MSRSILDLELAIMHLLLAAFFALTIIGFPLAVQHMKLVPMALLPFGHVMRVDKTRVVTTGKRTALVPGKLGFNRAIE